MRAGAVRWFEGELQDITQQLEHVERLQAAIKSKSDLIAAVSHELRTPLTAVVGYLDLLAGGPIEHSGDMLAVAAEQAHEVAAIVDDLLTAARLDNRELLVNAEEVDVVGTVRSAVRSLGNPYVLMSLPLQLTAVGDAARIRQILRNLIGNAYRYGMPPVSVHAEANGGTVSIVVADRGDPISTGVESQMFEPFFTTGVGESQPGAIGLGLAVSRQLARRMGGDLRHDRVGAETRFTLELPASAGEVQRRPPAAGRTVQVAGCRLPVARSAVCLLPAYRLTCHLSQQHPRRPGHRVFQIAGAGEHLGTLPEAVYRFVAPASGHLEAERRPEPVPGMLQVETDHLAEHAFPGGGLGATAIDGLADCPRLGDQPSDAAIDEEIGVALDDRHEGANIVEFVGSAGGGEERGHAVAPLHHPLQRLGILEILHPLGDSLLIDGK